MVIFGKYRQFPHLKEGVRDLGSLRMPFGCWVMLGARGSSPCG